MLCADYLFAPASGNNRSLATLLQNSCAALFAEARKGLAEQKGLLQATVYVMLFKEAAMRMFIRLDQMTVSSLREAQRRRHFHPTLLNAETLLADLRRYVAHLGNSLQTATLTYAAMPSVTMPSDLLTRYEADITAAVKTVTDTLNYLDQTLAAYLLSAPPPAKPQEPGASGAH